MWQRFSNRVEDYARYRPRYADAAVKFLIEEAELEPRAPVADVGSGTGIFTQQLLDAGLQVFAVEPGPEMRAAAEENLSKYALYRSVQGSSSDTGLDPRSVRLVTAAQAFHWFDPVAARAEFLRILMPGGQVGLLWNERADEPGFAREYEHFLHTHSIDYGDIKRGAAGAQSRLRTFFDKVPRVRLFENPQVLDWETLWGRFRSTSYSPNPEHPKFEPAREALRELFNRFESGGRVTYASMTELFLGRLES